MRNFVPLAVWISGSSDRRTPPLRCGRTRAKKRAFLRNFPKSGVGRISPPRNGSRTASAAGSALLRRLIAGSHRKPAAATAPRTIWRRVGMTVRPFLRAGWNARPQSTTQYRGELIPDRILEADQKRRAQHRRRGIVLLGGRHEDRHPDFTIGVIGITAAVAAVERRTDAGHLVAGVHHPGGVQVGGEEFAHRVDVGRNMVRDLPGIMAKAHGAVERRRAEPDRSVFGPLVE